MKLYPMTLDIIGIGVAFYTEVILGLRKSYLDNSGLLNTYYMPGPVILTRKKQINRKTSSSKWPQDP